MSSFKGGPQKTADAKECFTALIYACTVHISTNSHSGVYTPTPLQYHRAQSEPTTTATHLRQVHR